MDSKKPLCKLIKKECRKDNDFEEFKELVRNSQYICKKCGRVAQCKRRLCKPKEL